MLNRFIYDINLLLYETVLVSRYNVSFKDTMAKRITVYPDEQTLRVLGETTPELNRALEVHGEQIVRATAAINDQLCRGEWSYLADCFNGTLFEPGFSNLGDCLAHGVEDEDEFYRTGQKRGVTVAALAEKLRRLSYIEAWAVVTAISWFWQHHEQINVDQDEWWTIGFRLAHKGRAEREGQTSED